jgi:hypothetical protein
VTNGKMNGKPDACFSQVMLYHHDSPAKTGAVEKEA